MTPTAAKGAVRSVIGAKARDARREPSQVGSARL